jgi:hypothetical protein
LEGQIDVSDQGNQPQNKPASPAPRPFQKGADAKQLTRPNLNTKYTAF